MQRFLLIFLLNLAHVYAVETLPAPQKMGDFPKEIPESSGVVKSPKHAGVYWTHNDSGNKPELLAIDGNGKLLAKLPVLNAENTDWEDIALDEQDRIILADIGDNFAKRTECRLYRVAEPDPTQKDPVDKVQVFRFVYPQKAAVDAESLIVRAGFAYVFTKEKKRTRVFRIPVPDQPPADVQTAELVAETEQSIYLTAADLSPDGKFLALLSYGLITVIELPDVFEKTGTPFPKPFEGKKRVRLIFIGQAEGIAWDGNDLVLTTEGGSIWRMTGAK